MLSRGAVTGVEVRYRVVEALLPRASRVRASGADQDPALPASLERFDRGASIGLTFGEELESPERDEFRRSFGRVVEPPAQRLVVLRGVVGLVDVNEARGLHQPRV